MERIFSFRWRPDGKAQREDSYWYNAEDGFLYVQRGDGELTRSFEASFVLETLSRKQGPLSPYSQKFFDYLNARLT